MLVSPRLGTFFPSTAAMCSRRDPNDQLSSKSQFSTTEHFFAGHVLQWRGDAGGEQRSIGVFTDGGHAALLPGSPTQGALGGSQQLAGRPRGEMFETLPLELPACH